MARMDRAAGSGFMFHAIHCATSGKSLASTLAAVTALVSMPGTHFGLIYAIATAWTCWAIHAYAKGKRFHVAPGLYAAADDSQKLRRIVLGIAICMHLGFTALMIGSLFNQSR